MVNDHVVMRLAGVGSVLVVALVLSACEGRPAEPLVDSGRSQMLNCVPGDNSASLSVDYDFDVEGHPTPAEAAHALLDDKNFPRQRYAEREAGFTAGGNRLLKYLDGDRVVAQVTIAQGPGGRWLATGLEKCLGVYNNG